MNYKKDNGAENMIDLYNKDPHHYFRNMSETIGDAYYKTTYRGHHYYRNSAIGSAIHIINLMGYRVVAELGISFGHSTTTMLENCDEIEKLYAIDSYKPYVDYYTSNIEVDKYEIDIIKNIALKTFSNLEPRHKNKLKVIIEDSDVVLDQFDDGELDFVFLDAHLNSEHIKKDLEKWYPKVRNGGMVAIHDTAFQTVAEEIQLFMERINFSGRFSDYDSLSCLIKPYD